MTEIIKAYRQDVPALRFIGKRYVNGDRIGKSFGTRWGEWFVNGWFDLIEERTGGVSAYEDSAANIGLMRGENENYEYWIGMFTPEGTDVPEGFGHVDFPEGAFGVCWIYGKEVELYGREAECLERLKEEGFEAGEWWFERFVCPRFTEPDKDRKVILDVGFVIRGECGGSADSDERSSNDDQD
ncbi:MAG: GyrI-like domain-containing protein [Defluviitaleaceae bacterium]|nr:GyrI-like domain-containing protein [Defluviitaleaceae bacterium]MCL2835204.1 GyrI-like domain-containing protein [Defluviitaleaceae bacterium]